MEPDQTLGTSNTPETSGIDEGLTLPPAAESPPSALGAELDIGSQAAAADAAPVREPIIRGKLDRFGVAMGTGRRKTAVARVRVKNGDGKITINERPLEEYFPLERDRRMIQAPLEATNTATSVDVWVRVTGGGPTGQTGAVVLGIARALTARNSSLSAALGEGGFLTRDGRMVERKKYGHKKARRSFQFSKR